MSTEHRTISLPIISDPSAQDLPQHGDKAIWRSLDDLAANPDFEEFARR